MSGENISIIQLSDSNYCITFSKNALAAIKEDKAAAIKVKIPSLTGTKELKFLFMNTSSFQARYKEFMGSQVEVKKPSRWKRLKLFLTRRSKLEIVKGTGASHLRRNK